MKSAFNAQPKAVEKQSPKYTKEQVAFRRKAALAGAAALALFSTGVGVDKLVSNHPEEVQATISFGGDMTTFSAAADAINSKYEAEKFDIRDLEGKMTDARKAELSAKGAAYRASDISTVQTGEVVTIDVPLTPEIQAAMASQSDDFQRTGSIHFSAIPQDKQ